MRHFYLLAVLLCYVSASAQNVTQPDQLDYIVEELKLPGGQRGNNVDAIVQGPGGFIWIGTHGGLHRFDGYEYVTYTPHPADTIGETTSLTFPYIENLYWDKQGMMWVCSYGNGAYRFDPSTEIFKHFKSSEGDSSTLSDAYATSAIEDANGNIWIGTEHGLNRFDPKAGTFKRYFANPAIKGAIANDDVRTLYVDKAGTLWIGTGFIFYTGEQGSLSKYNPDSDSFTNYSYDPKDKTSLWGQSVRSIREDSKGNFWVASYLGLSRFDRQTGKFERMNQDRSMPHASGAFENLASIPYSVLEDRSGGIWVGTLYNQDNTSNLVRFDMATGQSQVYPVMSTVWNLFESTDGTIWASGAGMGGKAYKIYPKAKTYNLQKGADAMDALANTDAFKRLATGTPAVRLVNDIIVDQKRGVIWVEGVVDKGGDDVVAFLGSYNRKDGKADFYALPELNIDGNIESSARPWDAHGMAVDSNGVVWGVVRSRKAAIYGFNPDTKRLQQFVMIPGDSTSLSSNNIVSIMMDSRGDIWAAAHEAGLNRLNPKTGKVKQYHFNSESDYNFPIALLESRDGKIWVGGLFAEKGTSYLAELDPETEKIRKVMFPDKNSLVTVTNLVQSPVSGVIYYSKAGGGIGQYDPEREALIGVPSMIESINVMGLEIDRSGVGWVALENGFLRLEETGGTFPFKETIGIEVQRRSGFLGDDGHIYFVTLGMGWIEIDPVQVAPDKSSDSLRVHLIDLFVQGEKQRPTPGGFLPKPIWEMTELILPHDVGSFLLRFSDYDFHSGVPQFQFRLYPYETEWSKTTHSPSANYFKVPPGKYTFQVRSMRQAGFNGVTTELVVTILPPWWKSWWAYSLYSLGIVVTTVIVYRTQKARLLKKERERTRDRELAQAKEVEKAYQELKAAQAQLVHSEKMASLGELTAGIAHEIQNPLNFVNNFAEVSKELLDEMRSELEAGNSKPAAELAKDVIENLEKINFHGKRADAIVKSMLLHSRKSTGQKELTDINELCDEYLRLSFHGLRAKDKSFNAKFETRLDPALPKVNVVPQDLGRVVLNLINNAFYAVSEKQRLNLSAFEPEVIVSTKKLKDKVEVRISDNGTGIPDKVKEKIFQPFFTTKPSGQGTGLGLSLAFDIITKGHDGELKVETSDGAGTTFIIMLPAA